jgi:GNAT superfamily N-acetyltransferase
MLSRALAANTTESCGTSAMRARTSRGSAARTGTPSTEISPLADALVDEAKRLSPDIVTLLVNEDNARAIRFYRRNGFAHAGKDVNPTSGRPVLRMEWKP